MTNVGQQAMVVEKAGLRFGRWLTPEGIRKLSLQGPGLPACLLDSSAPLTPIRADRMIGRKAALPPLFHWVLFLFSSLCSPPFCLVLLPLRSREHHVFNFSGPAAAVKSFQGDSSSFTAVSFLSFSLSLSLSLSLSYLGRFLLC